MLTLNRLRILLLGAGSDRLRMCGFGEKVLNGIWGLVYLSMRSIILEFAASYLRALLLMTSALVPSPSG